VNNKKLDLHGQLTSEINLLTQDMLSSGYLNMNKLDKFLENYEIL